MTPLSSVMASVRWIALGLLVVMISFTAMNAWLPKRELAPNRRPYQPNLVVLDVALVKDDLHSFG